MGEADVRPVPNAPRWAALRASSWDPGVTAQTSGSSSLALGFSVAVSVHVVKRSFTMQKDKTS